MIDNLARTILDLHIISTVLVDTILHLAKRTVVTNINPVVSLAFMGLTILDGDVQVFLDVHHFLHRVSPDL